MAFMHVHMTLYCIFDFIVMQPRPGTEPTCLKQSVDDALLSNFYFWK